MSFYRILNSKFRPRQNRNSSLECFCSTDYRFHVDTLIIGEHFFINGHKRACMAIACGNQLFVRCIVFPVIVWIHYIIFVNRIIIACRKTSATSVDLNLNACTKDSNVFILIGILYSIYVSRLSIPFSFGLLHLDTDLSNTLFA